MSSVQDKIAVCELPFERLDSYFCKIGECDFKTISATKLLSHFNVCHRQDKNFKSHCLHSSSCLHKEPFKSFDGLYKHLKTHHLSFFSVAVQSDKEIGNQELNEPDTHDTASISTLTQRGNFVCIPICFGVLNESLN